MTALLGALYLDRSLEEVRRGWKSRLAELGEPRLSLRVWAGRGSAVRVAVRARRGRNLPKRRFGTLVNAALGPEREELAEFWFLDPAEGEPGPLRLEGSGWEECLQGVSLAGIRQVRLWSPMVCPGPIRRELRAIGSGLGLQMNQAQGWTVVAVPRPKPKPPHPAPWQGNYGW